MDCVLLDPRIKKNDVVVECEKGVIMFSSPGLKSLHLDVERIR